MPVVQFPAPVIFHRTAYQGLNFTGVESIEIFCLIVIPEKNADMALVASGCPEAAEPLRTAALVRPVSLI